MSIEDGEPDGQALEEVPAEHWGEALEAPEDPGPVRYPEAVGCDVAADEAEPRHEEGPQPGAPEDAEGEPPSPPVNIQLEPSPAMLRLQAANEGFYRAQGDLAEKLEALRVLGGPALAASVKEPVERLIDAMQATVEQAWQELVMYAERDQAAR